jgi:hypothetical protein
VNPAWILLNGRLPDTIACRMRIASPQGSSPFARGEGAMRALGVDEPVGSRVTKIGSGGAEMVTGGLPPPRGDRAPLAVIMHQGGCGFAAGRPGSGATRLSNLRCGGGHG